MSCLQYSVATICDSDATVDEESDPETEYLGASNFEDCPEGIKKIDAIYEGICVPGSFVPHCRAPGMTVVDMAKAGPGQEEVERPVVVAWAFDRKAGGDLVIARHTPGRVLKEGLVVEVLDSQQSEADVKKIRLILQDDEFVKVPFLQDLDVLVDGISNDLL